MAEAKVTSVAALREFRAALAEFQSVVRQAISDVEIEARRGLEWISPDRASFWRHEVRRSSEAVAEAKDQLTNARAFKRVGDYAPSCIEEKKALERAKRRLEHAEMKQEAVQHWSRAARRGVDEFQGPVQQLMGMLEGEIPRAMAVLEKMAAVLDDYAATSTPRAVKWEDLTGASSSMARPAEESAPPEARDEADEGSGAKEGGAAS